MPSPAALRRLLLAALVLATVPAFMACARMPHAPRMTHAPLPPVYVAVDGDTLQRLCRGLPGNYRPGFTYFACAERDYRDGVCRIYSEPNPPRWIREDEEEHCQGGSHP